MSSQPNPTQSAYVAALLRRINIARSTVPAGGPTDRVLEKSSETIAAYDQIKEDAVWMAKLARGSSWPGEMAHSVEQAANRVIASLGTDADRAAVAALLAGGDR